MGVLTQRHGGTETQSGYGCLRQCWEGRRLASRATTAAPFGVRRPQDTKAAFAAHELSRNGDSSGYSCWFVSGVRPAFVSGGHVEPVRARRMRRGGRDEVSRPHATRTPQIAAGDSTCPAGVRGRAKRQKTLTPLATPLRARATIPPRSARRRSRSVRRGARHCRCDCPQSPLRHAGPCGCVRRRRSADASP